MGFSSSYRIFIIHIFNLSRIGASLLGANPEVNSNGLSINKILPELSQKDHSLLIYNIINLIDNSALWLTGLLAVGIIPAIQ